MMTTEVFWKATVLAIAARQSDKRIFEATLRGAHDVLTKLQVSYISVTRLVGTVIGVNISEILTTQAGRCSSMKWSVQYFRALVFSAARYVAP